MGNATTLKEFNKNRILNIINAKQPISRTEIASETNLALPTVLRIVGSLLEENMVIEVGKGEKDFGRKPIMLTINKNYGYFIGIRISSNLSAILTNFKGKILDKERIVLEDIIEPTHTAAEISRLVDTIIERNSLDRDKILGIGIARPGMRFKSGELIATSTFAGWERIDFDELMKQHIVDIPFVSTNISNCGLLGELWFGQLKEVKDAFYIMVANGVGGAALINGSLYHGKNDFAGHIGHETVNFDGEYCYCGNRGCLESYCSIPAIIKDVESRLISGAHTSSLIWSPGIKLTFDSIVKGCDSGDDLCKSALERAGDIMGIGIANIINLFNPSKIVLGGEVSSSCPVFFERAVKVAKDRAFSNDSSNIDIVLAKIDKYPEELGAVAFSMSKIYTEPHIN